jgi:hypothetical protein
MAIDILLLLLFTDVVQRDKQQSQNTHAGRRIQGGYESQPSYRADPMIDGSVLNFPSSGKTWFLRLLSTTKVGRKLASTAPQLICMG